MKSKNLFVIFMVAICLAGMVTLITYPILGDLPGGSAVAAGMVLYLRTKNKNPILWTTVGAVVGITTHTMLVAIIKMA